MNKPPKGVRQPWIKLDPETKRFRRKDGATKDPITRETPIKDLPGTVTKGLFLEFNEETCGMPVYIRFTIRDEDREVGGRVIPSLKRLYLEEKDPLEYRFAMKYLGSWDRWQRMYQSWSCRKEIDIWRHELDKLLKSEAFEKLRMEAEGGGKNAFEANKILSTGKWRDLETFKEKTRGRPSRQEIMANAKELLEEQRRIREAEKLLGLESQIDDGKPERPN